MFVVYMVGGKRDFSTVTDCMRDRRMVTRRLPRMGDSLAVELPALTRAALVRIQVPQPIHRRLLSFLAPIGALAKGDQFSQQVCDR